MKVNVRAITEQTLTGPGGTLPTRRFDLTFKTRAPRSTARRASTTSSGSCGSRFPRRASSVVRDDASSVATRAQIARNPTDADVTIPANGFNLAGTLTTPPRSPAACAHPAIVLVGGSDADRPRRNGRRRSRLRAAREGARRRRLPRPALRQARRRPERRPRPRPPRSPIMRTTWSRRCSGCRSATTWTSARSWSRAQRRRRGGADRGGARQDDRRRRRRSAPPGRHGRRSDPRAAAARARRPEAAAEPSGRREIELQKKIQAAVVSGTGWEGVPGRDAAAGRHAVVQERADLRSGGGRCRRRSSRSSSSREISTRRCRRPRPTARGAGARAQEGRRRSRPSTSRTSIICSCRRRRARSRNTALKDQVTRRSDDRDGKKTLTRGPEHFG